LKKNSRGRGKILTHSEKKTPKGLERRWATSKPKGVTLAPTEGKKKRTTGGHPHKKSISREEKGRVEGSPEKRQGKGEKKKQGKGHNGKQASNANAGKQ